jgi:hypothetical protein
MRLLPESKNNNVKVERQQADRLRVRGIAADGWYCVALRRDQLYVGQILNEARAGLRCEWKNIADSSSIHKKTIRPNKIPE